MKKLISTLSVILGMSIVNVVLADSSELINPDNGHSYKRFDTAQTWNQAKESCASKNAHLVTITSQKEQNWVLSQFALDRTHMFWMGATDAATEGKWEWIAGEAWNYQNWYSGEPNNLANEDHLEMLGTPRYGPGRWNDFNGSLSVFYVCEWEQARNTYSRAIALPDINANGSQDFALVGGFADNYMLFVYDGESQEVINQTVIQEKLNNRIESIKNAGDKNNNGAPELAIVIGNTNTKTSILQLQDTLTGEVLKKTTLPNLYSRAIALSDINANGIRDVALVGESGNDYLLFVYDGGTQAMISEAIISGKANYRISSLTRVKDSNNNGAPELAILITKVSDGSAVLQLQDTLTGTVLKTITLPNQ